jgi:hypothetical protein
MSSTSRYSTADTEPIIWHTDAMLKFLVHSADCTISEQELTSILAEFIDYILTLLHWHPAVLRDASEAAAFKTLIINGNSSDTASHSKASNCSRHSKRSLAISVLNSEP